ncbi:O-acyltransferase like protein [Pseudolycoriella hygida]|uniref:O-acyltransferase like protein n=1 Tax=Pseudolycoriella hygida TaxID=35572 RepID=A0A9Q0MWX9_9DIPT|nr:O-acyltransferase like protein [Pseudolycoriella hygida]
MPILRSALHDSTAKISSGILNGNVNLFGDYDQCLKIEGPANDLKGKYCLTYLQVSIPKHMPRLKHLYDLMHSHSAFISEFDDM